MTERHGDNGDHNNNENGDNDDDMSQRLAMTPPLLLCGDCVICHTYVIMLATSAADELSEGSR